MIEIKLTKDELVYRTNKQKRDKLFTDRAEQMLFWSLESLLEKELIEPCMDEYFQIIECARANLKKTYGET